MSARPAAPATSTTTTAAVTITATRRTLSAFADAVSGDAFDAGKAESGAKLRLESADRLRGAVLSALERLHAILDPEQRARLAYLIRTGTLTL